MELGGQALGSSQSKHNMAHCATTISPVCFYRDVNVCSSGFDRCHIKAYLVLITTLRAEKL